MTPGHDLSATASAQQEEDQVHPRRTRQERTMQQASAGERIGPW
jgi:hypothetical protein